MSRAALGLAGSGFDDPARGARSVITIILVVFALPVPGIGFAAPAAAAADEQERKGSGGEVARPPFRFLRQDEDWSVLDGLPPDDRRPFDAIKFVPLDASRSSWASFGGSARGRLEGWHDFAFAVPADNDDLFTLWRVTGHGDFHLGKHFRGFIELKSALAGRRELPGGERPLDADTFELQQGFVDLSALQAGPTRVVFRLGRRGLQFGKQRLVSPLPWGNTLRAWDGVSALVDHGPWFTSSFWTRPVIVDRTDLNRPDSGRSFYGVYATRAGARTLDLYFLGQGRDETTFAGLPGHEDRYTFGGRLDTPVGGPLTRFETEAAYQSGEAGNTDIRAWMLTFDLAWRLPAAACSPSLRLVLDLASGDSSAGGDLETFDQLFPLGHAYLGIMDFVARQNIAAVSLPFSCRPAARWTVAFTPHLFRRMESADALYNAGGGVVFPGNAGTSRDVGIELDTVVSYRISDHWAARGGYGRFFAGEFVQQAGGGAHMDFAYAQIEFRF